MLTLSDHVWTDLGEPVGSIQVTIHPIGTDGVVSNTQVGSTSTSSTTGEWVIENIDSSLSPTGMFAAQIRNPLTGQVRMRMGNAQLQVRSVVGPGGSAPLANSSVTGQLIADGAVSDTKLGNRTVDPAIEIPRANTGTVTQLLSWIVRILNDFGLWTGTVPVSLSAIKSHIDNRSNPHGVTTTQIGAVGTSNATVTDMRMGPSSSRPTGQSGNLYVDTTSNMTFAKDGTTWRAVGVSSYNDLTDLPTSGSLQNVFQTVRILGTNTFNLVADSPTDILNVQAGSGITITGDPGSDTMQISASGSSGGSSGNLTLGATDEISGSIPSLSTGSFKIMTGRQFITFSNSLGTLDFPASVSGVVSVLLSNRYINGTAHSFYAGLMTTDSITVYSDTLSNSIVGVDFLIIYW